MIDGQNYRANCLIHHIYGPIGKVQFSVLPNPEMQNFHVLCDLTVDFEAGFIRLLDKLTNGSKVEVNETGAYEEDNIHLLVLIT
jgi:hypothetical protein